MLPSEVFPDNLFEDPTMALVYAYCFGRLGRSGTKTRYRGRIVTFGEMGKLIPTNSPDQRLGLDKDATIRILKELEELGRIRLTLGEAFAVVTFTSILLPKEQSLSQEPVESGEPRRLTSAEFAHSYLTYVKRNLAPKTYENAARVMKRFAQDYAVFDLGRLTGLHLEDFKNARHGVISAATVKIDVRTMKAALEMAVAWGMIKENPFR